MAAKFTVQNVGTSLTLITTVERSGDPFTEASVEIKNAGTVAFNAFQIRRKSSLMEQAYVLAATTGDFANTAIIGCVKPDGTAGDPTTLGAGLSIILEIPFGPHSISEVWASVGSAVTAVRAAWEA